MRRILILVFLMTLISPAVLYGQGVDLHKKFVIVIDPGHGGKDPGAVATDTHSNKVVYEKDIVLAVSSKLRNLISSNLSDVTIIMTRDSDEFLTLRRRAQIANEERADIFIPIHINAASSSAPQGMRLYVMGPDNKSDSISMTVNRENSAILYEDDHEINYNTDEIESLINSRLAQIDDINQSWVLAEIMQRHCRSSIPSAWRQNMIGNGAFWVLRYAAMPSTYVELGFFTNPNDLTQLQTDDYQNKLAQMLFNAIKEYKNNVQYNASTITITAAQSENSTPSNEPNNPVVINPNAAVEAGATNNQTATPVQNVNAQQHTTQQQMPQQSIQTNNSVNLATTTIVVSNEPRPLFYVQVSSITINKPTNSRDFKSYAGRVEMRYIGGRYKYFVGGVETYQQGLRLLREVKREFPDAFLVSFLGEKQLSLKEAREY